MAADLSCAFGASYGLWASEINPDEFNQIQCQMMESVVGFCSSILYFFCSFERSLRNFQLRSKF